MNKVYLSGIVANAPAYVSKLGDEFPHVVFELCVSHRTSRGLLKREMYTISAWNKVADWAHTHLSQGRRVMLQGYLTQRMMKDEANAVLVEVTAEEISAGEA